MNLATSPGYDYFMCLRYAQGKNYVESFQEWQNMPPGEKEIWARAEDAYRKKMK